MVMTLIRICVHEEGKSVFLFAVPMVMMMTLKMVYGDDVAAVDRVFHHKFIQFFALFSFHLHLLLLPPRFRLRLSG